VKTIKPPDIFDTINMILRRLSVLERRNVFENSAIDIGNATVGRLFVDTSGNLKYTSPGGTTTTIAPN
jgi:hypothetical protein